MKIEWRMIKEFNKITDTIMDKQSDFMSSWRSQKESVIIVIAYTIYHIRTQALEQSKINGSMSAGGLCVLHDLSHYMNVIPCRGGPIIRCHTTSTAIIIPLNGKWTHSQVNTQPIIHRYQQIKVKFSSYFRRPGKIRSISRTKCHYLIIKYQNRIYLKQKRVTQLKQNIQRSRWFANPIHSRCIHLNNHSCL